MKDWGGGEEGGVKQEEGGEAVALDAIVSSSCAGHVASSFLPGVLLLPRPACRPGFGCFLTREGRRRGRPLGRERGASLFPRPGLERVASSKGVGSTLRFGLAVSWPRAFLRGEEKGDGRLFGCL